MSWEVVAALARILNLVQDDSDWLRVTVRG